MKFHLEIIISVIVLYLLYTKPPILTRYSNSILGKVILLMGVIYVANNMGKLPGLLAALVMIVLIYDNIEGFEEKLEKEKDKNKDTDAIEKLVNSLTKKNEDTNQESMTPSEKAVDDIKTIKECNELKDKLTKCSKEDGCFDLSGYDIRCVEGDLRISSNKNTINSTKP